MYTDEHIALLNEMGVLTTALMARRFKMEILKAREALKQIAEDHDNVIYMPYDKIWIDGRNNSRPPPNRRKPKYIKKPSKWKDVTKP